MFLLMSITNSIVADCLCALMLTRLKYRWQHQLWAYWTASLCIIRFIVSVLSPSSTSPFQDCVTSNTSSYLSPLDVLLPISCISVFLKLSSLPSRSAHYLLCPIPPFFFRAAHGEMHTFYALLNILFITKYTLCLKKKQDTKLLPITSRNVNRFSKFFHWYTHW